MQKFVLIRYIKTTSGSNFKFKRTVELPAVPVIETGIKLNDGSFFITRCITMVENNRIYVLVDNDPLVSDQELDERIKEYQADGWVLSEQIDNGNDH